MSRAEFVALPTERTARLGASVLVVRGELDVASAPTIEQRIAALEGEPGDVIIDLTECEFMDCAGLGPLVAARNRLLGSGRRVRLARSKADPGPAAGKHRHARAVLRRARCLTDEASSRSEGESGRRKTLA